MYFISNLSVTKRALHTVASITRMAKKFKDFVVREKPKKRIRTHKKRLNKRA